MFKNTVFSAVIIIFLLPVILIGQEDTTYVKGQVIIKVASPFSAIETINNIVETEQSWFNSLAQQYQINELKHIFNSNQYKNRQYYLAFFPEIYSVEEIVNSFSLEQQVELAIPNSIVELTGVPNDPFYNLQWALTKIKADSAWDIESGNSSVIIGITDSGTDLGDLFGRSPHPDLYGNLWNDNGSFGHNVVDTLLLPHDGFGHGTHVAGIAAAVTNNDTGICGIAGGGFGGDEGVQIMTVKCLNDLGRGYLSTVSEAVHWAADPDDNPATLDGAHV